MARYKGIEERCRAGGRGGFTLIELLVVIVIGGILSGIVVNAFIDMRHGMAVRNAQDNFLSFHAHARSVAIERGDLARLVVMPADDRLAIVLGPAGAGDTLRTMSVQNEHRVEMETDDGEIVLCMTPRGFAAPSCNSFVRSVEVSFSRGDRTSAVELRPLGQAERR